MIVLNRVVFVRKVAKRCMYQLHLFVYICLLIVIEMQCVSMTMTTFFLLALDFLLLFFFFLCLLRRLINFHP